MSRYSGVPSTGELFPNESQNSGEEKNDSHIRKSLKASFLFAKRIYDLAFLYNASCN